MDNILIYVNFALNNETTLMKKHFLTALLAVLVSGSSYAQVYATKTGFIRFISGTSQEKIEATNRQVNVALDASGGNLVLKLAMESFVFDKTADKEEFNVNYAETNKYPTSTFLGKIVNLKEVNFSKEGTYPVNIDGKLTIHGETRQISEKGIFEIREGKLIVRSTFSILLSDYKISVTDTTTNPYSKAIEVSVDMVLDKIN